MSLRLFQRGRAAFLVLAAAALYASCSDPTSPARPTAPQPQPVDTTKGLRPEGVYEFTVTGLGTNEMSATARKVGTAAGVSVDANGAPIQAALVQVASGLNFELASVNSFVEGTRGVDGWRYAMLTYRVQNATGAPVSNVTLIPNTTATTIAGTPWISLKLFNGTAASNSIAQNIVPTGAVALGEDILVHSLYADVLQVFTEAEIAAIPLPSGVTGFFPYGFMVRNALTPSSRTIPAQADANDFGGVLTFAFRFPLQATSSADPFSFTFWAVAYQDSETRLTESMEEASDTAGVRRARERAAALGVTTTTVLNGSSVMDPAVPDYPGQRQICSVRTAGTAASPTTFMTTPGPFSTVALYWPGETPDACAAYFRTGSGRPATNVQFGIQARAMDRYGNTRTNVTETVKLLQNGGPAAVLPSPVAFTAGVASVPVTYSDYGYSNLVGIANRVRGTRGVSIFGVTRNWTAGAGTTNWQTGGNWAGGAVPMSQDTAYIPAAAPLKPALSANASIFGVTVENTATISLGAFDLTVGGDVATGTSGGITNSSGRLFLTGIGRTLIGVVPTIRVTGTYSLTGTVNARAPVQADAGRLTTGSFRLQADSY